MKRAFAALLLLVCLLWVVPGAVRAEENYDDAFQRALSFLDMYYELNAEYMVTTMNSHFYDWDVGMQTDFAPMTVPAEEYEAQLNLRFAITPTLLTQIRALANYDAAAKTYQVPFEGGFGGNLPNRVYCGYRALVDGGYEVYYQQVTYEYLPDNATIWDEIEKNNYPDTVEYQGKTYSNGPNGYYYLSSYDGYGNVYLVEYLNGTVRILSKNSFSGEFVPDVPKDVTYDVSEDANIRLTGGSFPAGTVVKAALATKVATLQKAEEAMAQISGKYKVFEITAMLDGQFVQPDAPVKLTATLPDGFGENVGIFWVDDNGTAQPLEVRKEVAGTVTVDLEHFSVYVLADLDSKPQEPSADPEPSEPTASDPAAETKTPVENTNEANNAPAGEPDQKGDMVLYIGLGVAAVLLVMAVVLILIRKKY